MNDSVKDKILFAISLLATLFTIQPVLAAVASVGFDLFNFRATLQHLYYGVAMLMSLAVYCYAINFITERYFLTVQKIGNIFYALSLILPLFFLLIWIILRVGSLIAPVFQTEIFKNILAGILGMVGSVISLYVAKRLSRRDRRSKVTALTHDEANHIQRAHQMLKAGHNDLSVLESYRAVETAFKRLIIEKQLLVPLRGPQDIVNWAKKTKIPPESALEELDMLRRLRNDAIHSDKPIANDCAENAFRIAKSLLSMLDRIESQEEEEEEEEEEEGEGDSTVGENVQ